MSLKFLASLIIFIVFVYSIIVVAQTTRRQRTLAEKAEQEFWDREKRANSVRCGELLTYLSTQPIVNLTGFTNTDLKLEYGTANITPLSQYDQNYTTLVRTLQQWAELLLKAELKEEAETVLSYAISIGTDVSHTYYCLAEIYADRAEYDKIAGLIHQAEGLRSALRGSIVRTLQESYPQASRPHCG